MRDAPPLDLQPLTVTVAGKKPGLLSSAKAFRAKVPGGWLVYFSESSGSGVTFYPDPNHAWDGGTVNGKD